MQKAHSNINWENLPSKNTPLGAYLLNKQDREIDVIDDRVLSLYGYESRVAQSEKNAKTSETNAKTSETNAKQSELKAKEYMENAFAGTPEGYEQIVDTVQKMDIKESADTTLLDSKEGGYKLLSMSGKSVQNGTPTPDYPQSIYNVGDCVEIVQGVYADSTGAFTASVEGVCSKNEIPCQSGDSIVIGVPSGLYTNILVAYFNGDSYLSGAQNQEVFTVPSNATSFKFSVINYNTNITPDKVGKILLTINGKYVLQVKSVGKNLLKTTSQSISQNGATCIVDTNGGVTVSGTPTSVTYLNLSTIILGAGTYILSSDKTFDTTTYFYLNNITTGDMIKLSGKKETTFTLEKDCICIANVAFEKPNTSVNLLFFYPMIRKADITDDTYEPYKEKVANVRLNEPLRDGDVITRTEVVRKRAKVVFDGSDDEGWYFEPISARLITSLLKNIIKSTENANRHNGLCNQYNVISANETYLKNTGISSEIYCDVLVYDPQFTTLAEWVEHLSNNPMEFEYELSEPIIEELDKDSQIALNSLETFDTVTYISVDSRTQPSEIKGEYGTSNVGARTIKNELKNDTLEIKYNELAVALVATESGV